MKPANLAQRLGRMPGFPADDRLRGPAVYPATTIRIRNTSRKAAQSGRVRVAPAAVLFPALRHKSGAKAVARCDTAARCSEADLKTGFGAK